MDELQSDYERAQRYQALLIARSTGGEVNDSEFQVFRNLFVDNPKYKSVLPSWVRVNRNSDQFWQFIKSKFDNYADRRAFIYSEMAPFLDHLETTNTLPAAKSIDDMLSKLDSDGINLAWKKGLERKLQDPEGAITISRSILESVCKHILHGLRVEFNETNIELSELSELYKLTASELNMSPDQHTEKIFKQILGGCSGVVNGLGALRNKHGDAHGAGPAGVKPKVRHAELAVNLAGTMSLFLVQTYEAGRV